MRSFLIASITCLITFGVVSCKKEQSTSTSTSTKVCSDDSTSIEKSHVLERDGDIFLWGGEGSDFDFKITDWTLHTCRLHQGLGINSIKGVNTPEFYNIPEALDHLNSNDQYILVNINQQKKLYPLGDLSIYEVINDEIGSTPIMVAYCYLADLVAVYNRSYCGKTYEFQATGYTYRDDNYFDGNQVFLLFDKQTRSIWFPGTSQAVSGPLKGNSLSVIMGNEIPRGTLGELAIAHPDALVLKENQISIDRPIDLLSGDICF